LAASPTTCSPARGSGFLISGAPLLIQSPCPARDPWNPNGSACPSGFWPRHPRSCLVTRPVPHAVSRTGRGQGTTQESRGRPGEENMPAPRRSQARASLRVGADRPVESRNRRFEETTARSTGESPKYAVGPSSQGRNPCSQGYAPVRVIGICSTWNGKVNLTGARGSLFHVEQPQLLTSGRWQARICAVRRRYGSPT
jgi:hypothetical protein